MLRWCTYFVRIARIARRTAGRGAAGPARRSPHIRFLSATPFFAAYGPPFKCFFFCFLVLFVAPSSVFLVFPRAFRRRQKKIGGHLCRWRVFLLGSFFVLFDAGEFFLRGGVFCFYAHLAFAVRSASYFSQRRR